MIGLAKKAKFFIKLTIILSITFNQSFAAQDLFSVYKQAWLMDPILSTAEKRSKAANEGILQAEALFLPTISAELNSSANFDERSNIGRYGLHGFTLNLSQSILNLSNASRWCEAKNTANQAELNYEFTKQTLILRIAEAYFAVLSAKDNHELAKSLLTATEGFLDQTEQRYAAGLIAITDVNEARARRDSTRAQEILFANEVKNQLERLKEITGSDINELVPLRVDIPLIKPYPDSIEDWVCIATKNNLALQAAKSGVIAAKQAIITACNNHYPTVQFTANFGRRSNTPPFIDNPPQFVSARRSTTGNIGIRVSIPIFSGGSVISQTREARYNYEAQDQELLQLYRQTISNTRQFFRGVLTKISQVKALQQAVFSSQSALEATEAGFDAGTRTIVDVLNSQSDLTTAKSEYSQARYDYLIETLRLKQAAGLISPNDLYAISQLLSPKCCSQTAKFSNTACATPRLD